MPCHRTGYDGHNTRTPATQIHGLRENINERQIKQRNKIERKAEKRKEKKRKKEGRQIPRAKEIRIAREDQRAGLVVSYLACHTAERNAWVENSAIQQTLRVLLLYCYSREK